LFPILAAADQVYDFMQVIQGFFQPSTMCCLSRACFEIMVGPAYNNI
jgi:hypothetical protein